MNDYDEEYFGRHDIPALEKKRREKYTTKSTKELFKKIIFGFSQQVAIMKSHLIFKE